MKQKNELSEHDREVVKRFREMVETSNRTKKAIAALMGFNYTVMFPSADHQIGMGIVDKMRQAVHSGKRLDEYLDEQPGALVKAGAKKQPGATVSVKPLGNKEVEIRIRMKIEVDEREVAV